MAGSISRDPESKGVGTGNWYNNGSPEAEADLVAPSYHGLCGRGRYAERIFLVPATGPGGVPTLPQCP